jgi:hypothetical protein
MTISVQFLSDQQIEEEARSLLKGYYHQQGEPLQIPVPVDDILETHLGLSLDFDDLKKIVGVPDVLGALWVDRREVFIDQSLDPYECPEMLGRYHFSIGHEIGHWCLHRHYLANAGNQTDMFTVAEPQPAVICRTSQARERIEIQADRFAACLLMPWKMVLKRFDSARFKSLTLTEVKDYVLPGLAEEFAVSRSAMLIRLDQLGLLWDEHHDDQYLMANY